MERKRGRPRVKHPKKNALCVRIGDCDIELLHEYCKEKGVSYSEAVRKSIRLFLEEEK